MSVQAGNARLVASAALGCAATFIVGFVLLVWQMMPYVAMATQPAAAVGFVQQHHALLLLWNFVIYLVFGVLLAVLVVGLYQRLQGQGNTLNPLAAVFGIVWVALVLATGMVANVGLSRVLALADVNPVQAEHLWLSLKMVTEGLGGGNEIVGGLWMVLVSLATWQHRLLPRWLSAVGILAGLAGVVSTVPPLADLGAVFGLLSIVWFAGLGGCLWLGERYRGEDEG